jgi:hypothetical protein
LERHGRNLLIYEVEGMVKKEIMYSRPHCDSILGFGFSSAVC